MSVRIVLVASEFNAPIPQRMLEAAERKARSLQATVVDTVRVPGAWELPLAVQAALARRDVDAVVALGAIVKGQTEHDELIAKAVADALMRLMLDAGKPVGLGVTGPGMTWEQAEARVSNAERAVAAAVRAAEVLAASKARPTRTRRR